LCGVRFAAREKSQLKILIVDDERSYGSLLASALKKLGHRSVVCERPMEALAAVREDKLDAAFVDLVMPEQSGFDLARSLQAVQPKLSVAFIAGSASDAEQARLGESTPLLPKVWTVHDVRHILQQIRRAKTAPQAQSSSAVPEARIARGSGKLIPPPSARRRISSETIDLDETRVVVRCRDWEHLEALCRPALDGKGTQINIRARQPAQLGQRLSVIVTLPNELAIVVSSVVEEITPLTNNRYQLLVYLEGMDPQLAGKLMGVMERESGVEGP